MARGTLRIRITGDANPLQRTLASAGGMLSGFAKKGMLAAGAAVAAGVAVSVKAFADFDGAMTQSLAIMGDVSDAMRNEMSDAAREVAKTTDFSAQQAAESYFFLASAGLDAKQSIAALPQVAAFAQAGMFDMARATDLATDAQSALGLASDDADKNLQNLTRITDVFVKANTLANASVEQFAEAITGKAGASMRQLGVDVEEGVAVLSVFADQGLKGSEASTILARSLDGLAERSRESATDFERLGITVFDADGEMRNMADITSDMERAFAGMSTEQRNAELASLGFNERTRRGIQMMLENSEAIREYEGELRDAAGTTQEVADKQLQTFWKQLGLLKDQFLDIAISIGEFLVPHLQGLVEWIGENMPAIQEGIETALQGAVSFIEDVVVPGFLTLKGAWDDHVAPLVEKAKTVGEGILDELRPVSEWMDREGREGIRDWSTEWQERFDRVGQSGRDLQTGISGVMDALGIKLGESEGDARSWGATIVQVAGFAFDSFWQMFVEPFFVAARFVLADIEQMIRNFREFGAVIADVFLTVAGWLFWVQTQFRTFGAFIADTFLNLKDDILGHIETIRTEGVSGMFSVGASLMSGLARGIAEFAWNPAGALGRVVGGLVRRARDAVGASSPAKEFIRLGEDSMEGLKVGLDRNAAEPLRIMRALSDDLLRMADVEADMQLRSLAAGDPQMRAGEGLGGGLTSSEGAGVSTVRLADEDRELLRRVAEGESLEGAKLKITGWDDNGELAVQVEMSQRKRARRG